MVGGHDHDHAEAGAEDGVLAEVERGEAGRGLQRRVLVHLQARVVLLQLVLLVVEILEYIQFLYS